MSTSFAAWDEGAFAAAVDRLVTDPAHLTELEVDAEGLQELERVATAIHLASLDALEPPPPALLDRLHADARTRFCPATIERGGARP